MEILIGLVVLGLFAKYGVTDLMYAAKGKPSPRQQLAAKRLDLAAKKLEQGKGNRTPNRTANNRWRSGRHAGQQYVSALWHDALEDAKAGHDRHRAKRQQRRDDIAAGRRLRWRDQPGALRTFVREVGESVWQRWDDAWDKRAVNLHDKRTKPPALEETVDPIDTAPVDTPVEPIEVEVPQGAQPVDFADPTPPTPSTTSTGPDPGLNTSPHTANGQGPDSNQRPKPDFLAVEHDAPAAFAERTTGSYECPEPDCTGHQVNEPLQRCRKEGCNGFLVPVDKVHHDADGGVMIDTRCSDDCGTQGTSYDAWNPPKTWSDPEGAAYDDGVDDARAELDPAYPGQRTPIHVALGHVAQAEEEGEDDAAAHWRGFADELIRHAEQNGGTPPATKIPDCSWCEPGNPATKQQLTQYPDDPDQNRTEVACDRHADQMFWPPGERQFARPAFTGPVVAVQPVPDWSAPPATPSNDFPTLTGGTVSAPTAEVSGIQTAIAWAHQAAESANTFPATAEQFRAGLEAHGVSGEVLEAAAQYQEAAGQMAAAASRMETVLETHRSLVSEGYAATGNEAGDKDFMTQE